MTFRLSDRTVGLVAQTPEDCDDNAEQIAYHLAVEVQDWRAVATELRLLLNAALSPQCTHTQRQALTDTARLRLASMHARASA